MANTKKKKESTSAVKRISSALTASEKIGIPRDAAMFTVISMEIQILENRVCELEGRIKDLEELPASEFPRGQR